MLGIQSRLEGVSLHNGSGLSIGYDGPFVCLIFEPENRRFQIRFGC